MTEEIEDTYSESYMRRLRNLKMFKGKTDEEILTYLRNRPAKPLPPDPIVQPTDPEALDDYDRLFKVKLKTLQKEYAIDMNDANDADALRSLVRLTLQLEMADQKIRDLTSKKGASAAFFNTKALDDLGKYQRSIQMSVNDLQEKLGITRKARKEKQIDDIPKYIAELQERALKTWKRKTIPVICEKDQIELLRYWVNFPSLENNIMLELECWKCREKIIYSA